LESDAGNARKRRKKRRGKSIEFFNPLMVDPKKRNVGGSKGKKEKKKDALFLFFPQPLKGRQVPGSQRGKGKGGKKKAVPIGGPRMLTPPGLL